MDYLEKRRTKEWLRLYYIELMELLEMEGPGPVSETVSGLQHECKNLEGRARRRCREDQAEGIIRGIRHNADVMLNRKEG